MPSPEQGGQAQEISPALRHINASRSYVERPNDTRLETIYANYLDLSRGESPFGAPAYISTLINDWATSGELMRVGEHYQAPDVEKGKRNIRKRFSISERPYITFSDGGSDEILERFIWFLDQKIDPDNKPTRIVGFGPHFPDIVTFASRLQTFGSQILYTPLGSDVGESFSLSAKRAENLLKRKSREQDFVFYICNPATPTGAVAENEDLENFVKIASQMNATVIIDEAFGDVLEDNESAIRLVDQIDEKTGETKYKNLIVLRSYGKIMSLAGFKIGYAVMSPNLEEDFEKLKRDYSINGFAKLLINQGTDPEQTQIHLQKVRPQIAENKEKFVRNLNNVGISPFPTDTRTPILLLDGKVRNFHSELERNGVKATPVSGFSRTFYPQHLLTDQYARLTVPATADEIVEATIRIKAAMIDARDIAAGRITL